MSAMMKVMMLYYLYFQKSLSTVRLPIEDTIVVGNKLRWNAPYILCHLCRPVTKMVNELVDFQSQNTLASVRVT